MNIVCCNPDGGAFLYITNGIQNAFVRLGHKFIKWDGKSDLASVKPDLYIGCSGWRQTISPKIRSQFNTKVMIHVNPYGSNKVGAHGGPVIDESPEAIKWVVSQKPDTVFCYADAITVKEYFNFWEEKHGIKVIPMPMAADYITYSSGVYDDRLSCQIGWIGGKWPYKSIMMNKYLEPLLKKYRCRFHGWNDPWKMGHIDDRNAPKLFNSSIICPSVSEPHTVHVPIDVPERLYKVPCSGGFTIHTPTIALDRLGLSDVIPVAKDEKNWFELIEYYINNKGKRDEMCLKQRERILKHHTYFNRIEVILQSLGRPHEADKAREVSNSIKI